MEQQDQIRVAEAAERKELAADVAERASIPRRSVYVEGAPVGLGDFVRDAARGDDGSTGSVTGSDEMPTGTREAAIASSDLYGPASAGTGESAPLAGESADVEAMSSSDVGAAEARMGDSDAAKARRDSESAY